MKLAREMMLMGFQRKSWKPSRRINRTPVNLLVLRRKPMIKLKRGLCSGGSEFERPEEIVWPSDMGPPPAKLMVEAIWQAAMTFPVGTGLG